MGSFFKIIIIIMLIVGILYAGACVYENWIKQEPGEYKLPEATFEIRIRNTGNVLYTDIYDTQGSSIILRGYWEVIDEKYKFRDREIILDKKIFGEIIIRRR